MLSQINQVQQDIDRANTPQLRAQATRTDRKTTQALQSIAALQEGLGTFGSDLALAKKKIPADPKAKIVELEDNLGQLQHMVSSLQIPDDPKAQLSDIEDTLQQLQSATQGLTSSLSSLMTKVQNDQDRDERQNDAMSGNIHLIADAAEDISKAMLDAAAVGTFTRQTTVQLVAQQTVNEETLSNPHLWANFAPVIVPTSDDEDVAAPTVTWTDEAETAPRFVGGSARLTVTFLTGTGVHYTVGKTFTVPVQVAADNKMPFGGLTVTQAVKTYHVVA
jgi:hypothetical protein